MVRNLFRLLVRSLLGLGSFLHLLEDGEDSREKIMTSYPNARFLSQVDSPSGASVVFLYEKGELIAVLRDRVFHSSIVHRNDNFCCK